MTSVADSVRSFGVSGLLITEELRALQQKFGLDLLAHGATESVLSQADFYPQFEQSVRSEAGEMAGHYELFYCLEK